MTMGFVAAGATMVGATTWSTVLAQSTTDDTPRWSDPATWGGKVPAPGEWVSLDRPVVLDVDAQVDGLAIQIGGALILDPNRSCTLTSTANIVVLGLLQMRPSSAAVNHLIRFTGIDESKFVGGGHMVLDTDVGLWCLNDGMVDIAGTPRRAWARTTTSVAAGAKNITLQVEPLGWQVGDEIAIVPTLGTEHPKHHDAYDYAQVTSVSGSTVGLSVPTEFAHPAMDVGNGIVVAPEVLNLTRNVNIEGTPGGRAHVMFMHTTKPQQLSHFGARWVGPRQPTGEKDFTSGVIGRYGLHFHMVGDASADRTSWVVWYEMQATMHSFRTKATASRSRRASATTPSTTPIGGIQERSLERRHRPLTKLPTSAAWRPVFAPIRRSEVPGSRDSTWVRGRAIVFWIASQWVFRATRIPQGSFGPRGPKASGTSSVAYPTTTRFMGSSCGRTPRALTSSRTLPATTTGALESATART